MKEKSIVTTAAAGLIIGCVLGVAGSFVTSATVRSIAWALDSAAIILASSLLTLHYFKNGEQMTAAGFLNFAIAETVIFSSSALDLNANIPAFGAGTFLWAISLTVISLQKVFPLVVRCAGLIAAVLFIIVSFLILTGHPVNALTKPLPFYAYPFFALTLLGWAWALLKKRAS